MWNLRLWNKYGMCGNSRCHVQGSAGLRKGYRVVVDRGNSVLTMLASRFVCSRCARRVFDEKRYQMQGSDYDDHDDHHHNNDHDHDDCFLARNHERSIGWHVPYSARYQCRWNEQIQSRRNRSNCARHKPARVQCSVTSGFDRDAATRTGDGCFGAETYMCIPNEIRPPAEHHRRRSQEYGG